MIWGLFGVLQLAFCTSFQRGEDRKKWVGSDKICVAICSVLDLYN